MLCLLKGKSLAEQYGITRFFHYSPKPLVHFQAILDSGEVFEPEAERPVVHRAVMDNDDGELGGAPFALEDKDDEVPDVLGPSELFGMQDQLPDEEETLEQALERDIEQLLAEQDANGDRDQDDDDVHQSDVDDGGEGGGMWRYYAVAANTTG